MDVLGGTDTCRIVFILAFMIPESPRWLAANKRMVQAQTILSRIGGNHYAMQTLSEMSQLGVEQKEKSSWKQLFILQSGKS